MAENVVAIRSADEAEASLPPLHDCPRRHYLGRILRIGGETVQLIDVTAGSCRPHLLAGFLSSPSRLPRPGQDRP